MENVQLGVVIINFSVFFKDVRLIGRSHWEGRLEIYHDGIWGTVCGNNWDKNAGRVVCRQLGYPGVDNLLRPSAFPSGSDKIWLDFVSCNGTEKSLSYCKHGDWGKHNCENNGQVELRCTKGLC